MASLAPLLDLLPDERVNALLDAREPISLPEPVRPYLLAALASHLEKPVLVVVARIEEAEHLARDVQAFLGPRGAEVFPGWEVLPGEPVSPSVETMGRRLQVLARLREDDSFVVVATAQSVSQLVAPPKDNLSVTTLVRDMELDLDGFTQRLVDMGYERNYMVERRGEFAVRGGILDLFPPGADRPVRAELWGDEVTSLRRFALASQRSLEEIDRVDVAPARELLTDDWTRQRAEELMDEIDDEALAQLSEGILVPGAERLLPLLSGGLTPLTALFPQGSPGVILDPKLVRDRATDVMEQVGEWSRSSGVRADLHYADLDDVLGRLDSVLLMSSFTGHIRGIPEDEEDEGLVVGEAVPAETWTATAGKPELLAERLGRLTEQGYATVVAASLPETAENLRKSFEASGLRLEVTETAPSSDGDPKGSVVVADLGRGFVLEWARLALVAESDITGRRSGAARRRMVAKRRETSGPLDLSEGDLIVHEVHGIGRYVGMVERDLLGVHREYLQIEYAKGDRLYVPSDQIDLVSKYIGGEAPRVSRLGSADWSKTKSRVRRKAREIAHELVKLYAKRLNAPGVAFGPDTPWQRELEDSFAYEETPDQLRTIDEVKDDMERPIPMDRLVCGDVGYGKTEIAVRAAFKAVANGKQVAVLVPTTILAQQHHATFLERFRHWPVRVEMLSRFLSPAESRKIIEDLANGKVDVVVGTHKLLQGDVKFSDLGLVIVDEEQRFGVEQKEKLKALRANVDFLTLTATPIPRTLEMAMSGIRDMSIVDTPPENRHPVMTYVGETEDGVITSAIRRELLRDGQVFYVHHRVDTIEAEARRIQGLVPEARVGVAHGQMDERTLENAMLEFGEKKTNVLVCTTIIESGLDIPSVNTLIVGRADLLGLSQMYQLRGRVGRAHERAYAYLFFPPERALTEGAQERLKTIASNTGLGSGFRIAMKDLEIRGAGNLLGGEQHGHISEVGFDLYVKLVASAVDEAKGTPWQEETEVRIDLPLQAFIPRSYIADENLRLEAYRRIASARDSESLAAVRAELSDRYGSPVPPPVEALFELATLRRMMVERGITEAATVARTLRIRPVELEESRQVRLQRILPDAEWRPANQTLLVPERLVPKDGVVAWVSDLLQQLTSTPS
ncbi:MAG: transcription-repair coupling factor [Actinomycetota bacterium]|nr:transcription-repair coupling factor [Actinomycetota bacterium]